MNLFVLSAGPASWAMQEDRAVMDGQVDNEDRRDIAESLRGGEDAFARLVRRYQPEIARQMHRFTRDRLQLEELVQEVFVQAYLSLRGFKGDAPFLHWLRRIATRVGYRHWRRISRERTLNADLRESLRNPALARMEDPSEAAELLYRLLEQLPARERLVLTLLYFEECGTREIAERTGWSRPLVKVCAFRARKRMRQMLENAGIEGIEK